MNTWFSDAKEVSLRLKFGEDQQVIHEDGRTEEIYIPMNKRERIISWDETDHPLSRENDNGGSRSTTFTDPNLPRCGGASTRGAHHVTAVHAVMAAYEVIPPMYIFDSKAEKSENYSQKASWVEGLPIVTGKFGCDVVKKYPSFTTVTKSGSMIDKKFCQYIETCIVKLYPNLSKEWSINENGEIISGPILIKTDAGPGRLCANFSNVSFRQRLNEMGAHIILSLPNATSVQAELDDMYRDYKGACRNRNQKVFSDKV